MRLSIALIVLGLLTAPLAHAEDAHGPAGCINGCRPNLNVTPAIAYVNQEASLSLVADYLEAGAHVLLFTSLSTGTVELGNVQLDLGTPLVYFYLGQADQNGVLTVPMTLTPPPELADVTLHLQAIEAVDNVGVLALRSSYATLLDFLGA